MKHLDNVFASSEFRTSDNMGYNRRDRRGWTVAEPDQFPVFDVTVRRRGRAWRWSVSTTEGAVVMDGSERSRAAAAYQANRAIFLLLSTAPTNVLVCAVRDFGSPTRTSSVDAGLGRAPRSL